LARRLDFALQIQWHQLEFDEQTAISIDDVLAFFAAESLSTNTLCENENDRDQHRPGQPKGSLGGPAAAAFRECV
jgi:hypothetical protein